MINHMHARVTGLWQYLAQGACLQRSNTKTIATSVTKNKKLQATREWLFRNNTGMSWLSHIPILDIPAEMSNGYMTLCYELQCINRRTQHHDLSSSDMQCAANQSFIVFLPIDLVTSGISLVRGTRLLWVMPLPCVFFGSKFLALFPGWHGRELSRLKLMK